MMLRSARVFVLVAVAGDWVTGCAHTDTPTADPEAQQLAPPVVIVDDPPAEAPVEVEPEVDAPAPAPDPNTEVITFGDADAEPGMTDEVTAAPKRKPLPSMMSDVLHGPNK